MQLRKEICISPDKVYSDDLNKLPSLQNYIQAHTIIFMAKSFVRQWCSFTNITTTWEFPPLPLGL